MNGQEALTEAATVPQLLLGIGSVFLAALVLEAIGRRLHVPRVTLLILFGALVGPPVLDWLPPGLDGSGEIFAPTALTMVAFLLGGTLRRDTLRVHGREIFVVSVTVVIVSCLLVIGGLYLIGVPVAMALLLGGISSATDPAATRDVVRQSGTTNRFTVNLLGIVAIDDAWGLLLFSVMLTVAGVLAGGGEGNHLLAGLREGGGAVLLGLAIGLPAAKITGRLKAGEPSLVEALAVVFICAGLALALEVSFLLAGMVCGATVVNLAHHHQRPFHEIERVEWPFLLLFFVMAGASLQLDDLMGVGAVGAGYVVLRFVGRIIGGWLGGRLAGLPGEESRMTGFALMPQAGVAIGMALVVAERFPGFGNQVLAITIASTIVFELFGPLMTQYALGRVTRGSDPGAGAGPAR